jgi:hypothetical protein
VGAAFVAVLFLPLVCKVLRLEFVEPAREFRLFASRPALPRDLAGLKAFPGRFEAYFNDHFGLRALLIQGMHLVKGRWLDASTAAHALLGRDGWLYYTEKPPGTDYHAARPFRPEELERWRHILQKRHDWCERRGIPYLVFIPPDKQTIYPEHVPPELRPRHAESRLDQLLAYMRAHSNVILIDVRQAMWAAKDRERLYDVTDSHWNARGAFLGYEALVGELARWLPGIRPLARSAFVDTDYLKAGGDIAQMVALDRLRCEEVLGLGPRLPRRAHVCEAFLPDVYNTLGPPHATEYPDSSLPRAVMFHDSFTWALEPFLSEHFQRIVYGWTDQFNPELVRQEQPDVVVQELVERKLGFVIPDDFDDSRP